MPKKPMTQSPRSTQESIDFSPTIPIVQNFAYTPSPYIVIRNERYPYSIETSLVPELKDFSYPNFKTKTPSYEDFEEAHIRHFFEFGFDLKTVETELRLIRIYIASMDCEVNGQEIRKGEEFYHYRYAVSSYHGYVAGSRQQHIIFNVPFDKTSVIASSQYVSFPYFPEESPADSNFFSSSLPFYTTFIDFISTHKVPTYEFGRESYLDRCF